MKIIVIKNKKKYILFLLNIDEHFLNFIYLVHIYIIIHKAILNITIKAIILFEN
jgi:hypothetical protein